MLQQYVKGSLNHEGIRRFKIAMVRTKNRDVRTDGFRSTSLE